MTALDQLLKAPGGQSRGCRTCGAPSEARIGVEIKPINGQASAKSASVALCGDHAVELYRATTALIEKARTHA